MNKQTFIKYKTEFLTYLKNEKRVAYNTLKSYYLDLQQIECFWNSQETEHKKNFELEHIVKNFFKVFENNVSPSSYARKISCLNSFKRFLKKYNIALNISLKRPHLACKAPTTLDQKTLSNLLDTINLQDIPSKSPLRDRAIIELLYATGVRCSELANIELQHINFKDKYIIIRSARSKERIVYFGNQAYKSLINYLNYERMPLQNNYEKLFLSYKATPLSDRSIQRIFTIFRPFLPSNIILTPHILRHSFATHMLEQGADIDMMQQLLGHKRKTSTEKYLKNIKDMI